MKSKVFHLVQFRCLSRLCRCSESNAVAKQRPALSRRAKNEKQSVCRNEPLTHCRNGVSGNSIVLGRIGGRTRTRTWDPLIKRLSLIRANQWLSCKPGTTRIPENQ
jgi:hypothetical protein